MIEFRDLAALAAHFEKIAMLQSTVDKAALTKGAIRVERLAKSKIGTYQPEAGPFSEWRELAESTQADRRGKGFNEDDPLLRTGELRDSIGYTVEPHEAAVGSASQIASYQELGTRTIPPRSFLGSAAVESAQGFVEDTGRIAFRPFQNKPVTVMTDKHRADSDV